MITHLSTIVLNAFMQKISESENSCGFSLPLVFSNGSPAVVYAHKDTRNNVILNDYGLNIRHFEESLCIDDFDAIDKVKEFCKSYDSTYVSGGCLMAKSSLEQIDFAVIEYTELLTKLINYHYKSRTHHNIDRILESIRKVLEKKFSHIEVGPKITGRSGGKYSFDFAHQNTFIDYVQADKTKTNNLLRKMIDTQNLHDDISFNIIIDDLETDKYKSEQTILSDYAKVQPLSRFLAS